jgi:hypothetical protein
MLRKTPLLWLIFLVTALWAVDNSTVSTSTATVKRAHRPRQSNTQMRKLRAVGEKVLTPNPAFQNPNAGPMPAQAPKTPKLDRNAPTPSRSERFFKKVADVMTTSWNNNIFVWLPAVSTDPNTGPTYGILPVLVLSDPNEHHIRHLLAPSYTYNELFGQTVTGRYYFYPTAESQLFATASFSARTNRELKIRYEDAELLGGRIFLRTEAYYDVDGSQRFFGIGPNTRESDEAGFTSHDRVIRTDVGLNFLGNMRFATGIRYRHFGWTNNIIPNVDDFSVKFPVTAGQPRQDTLVQSFSLLWDTRDLPITPSKGSSGLFFFEKTNRAWGSDSHYTRYGLEGKRFIPWKQGKQITALHGMFDQANGGNIPFYELTMLGGRETLRGFGEGRFIDRGRILFNVEHRIELTSLALMGVTTKFEVGPFIDVGTVFPRPTDMQRKDFLTVYGASFRAAVKPNVVGSVDVGIGKEGVGVYVGINYPF